MADFDVTTTYAACPKCTCQYAKRWNMLPIVGVLGDMLFYPVKCINCGKIYNGKTGDANFAAILVFAGGLCVSGIFLSLMLFGR